MVREIKPESKPEAPASVTCIPMGFTRWSSDNSRYTCQPHIMGECNKLEFIYVFHHHENALSKLSLLDKTMQS